MANTSTDDWLYNDDLDVGLPSRDRLDSTDSRVLDGDLLDDVLTAPSNLPRISKQRSHTPANDDELLGDVKLEDESIEGSGSARYNAEQKARMVQARIDSQRTSQSVSGLGGTTIYSREPNRKNAVFIGNLTWWTTDLDLMQAVRDCGLRDIHCIKFYENRANGQSKGYALLELESDELAQLAVEKLQEITINDQKPVVTYALRTSPHQFESRCNAVKAGGSINMSSSSSSSISGSLSSTSMKSNTAQQQQPPQPQQQLPNPPLNLPAPPIRPPLPGLPGFPPPPIPGFRPPGLPGDPLGGAAALGMLGQHPPIPPPGLPGLPPNLPGLGNPLARPTVPGLGGLPPGLSHAMDQMKGMGVAPHLNPAFLQEMAAQGNPGAKGVQNMAELFARFRNQAAAAMGHGGPGGGGPGVGPMGGAASPGMGGAKQVSEEEAADANQRNRAISSSAISRAMSDANAGDYEGAVDTLRMAITLIKQSVTAGTESSQILIQSLQDCLHGIDEQAAMAKRSSSSRREHRSHDDRGERSGRSSHRSSKHHRDRSRERRR